MGMESSFSFSCSISFPFPSSFPCPSSFDLLVSAVMHAQGQGQGKGERGKKMMDQFIACFKEEPMESVLLNALVVVMKNTVLPSVRDYAYKFFLDWMKICFERAEGQLELPELALYVLFSGLTDVWSAIRKHCAKKLSGICSLMMSKQREQLFDLFFVAANVPFEEQPWQITDGAVLGMSAIISAFTIHLPLDSVQTSLSNSEEITVTLKIGNELFFDLPSFISKGNLLRNLLFHLLAHPQVSIREIVAETFTAYLARCSINESNQTLLEIFPKLIVDNSLKNAVGCLDAYEAEGLLSLCWNLIQKVSNCFIEDNWSSLISIFEAYLAHPASTVRQAVSSILLALVSKTSLMNLITCNSTFLRLILQSLASKWVVSPALFNNVSSFFKGAARKPENMHDVGAVVHSSLPPPIPAVLVRGGSYNEEKMSTSEASEASEKILPWEWKEGCLLFYELILEKLLQVHEQVISNINISFISPIGRHFSSKKSRRSMGNPTTAETPIVNLGFPSTDRLRRQSTGSNELIPLPSPFVSRLMNSVIIEKDFPATPVLCNSHEAMLDTHLDLLAPRTINEKIRMENSNSQFARNLQDVSILQIPAPMHTAVHTLKGSANCPLCEIKEYFESLNIIPFSQLLLQILVQTVECSLDSRWELRRMADQVLPLLIQVLCWFDAELLESIWQSCFSMNDFMKCVSSVSLKYALRTVLEFQQFLNDCTMTNMKKKHIQSMIKHVTKIIPMVVQHVFELYFQSVVDRLVTLSIEILIMIESEFSEKIPQSSQAMLFDIVLKHCLFIHDLSKRRAVIFDSHSFVNHSATFATSEISSPVSNALVTDVCPDSLQSLISPMSEKEKTFFDKLPRLSSLNNHSLYAIVSASRKAERVELWLLSCIHKQLPLFAKHFTIQNHFDFLGLFLKWFRCNKDFDIRLSLLRAIDGMLSSVLDSFDCLVARNPISPVLVSDVTFHLSLVVDSTLSEKSLYLKFFELIIFSVCELFPSTIENQFLSLLMGLLIKIFKNENCTQEVFVKRSLLPKILSCFASMLLNEVPKNFPGYFSSYLVNAATKIKFRQRSTILVAGTDSLQSPLSYPKILASVGSASRKDSCSSVAAPLENTSFFSPLNSLSDAKRSNSKQELANFEPLNEDTDLDSHKNDTDWDDWDELDAAEDVFESRLEILTSHVGLFLKTLLLIYNDECKFAAHKTVLCDAIEEDSGNLNWNQSTYLKNQIKNLQDDKKDALFYALVKQKIKTESI